MSGIASAWMCQWSNVPPAVVAPVVWRHQRGSPFTSATSVLTCAPVSSVHQKCPAVSSALYSRPRSDHLAAGAHAAQVHDRLGKHREATAASRHAARHPALATTRRRACRRSSDGADTTSRSPDPRWRCAHPPDTGCSRNTGSARDRLRRWAWSIAISYRTPYRIPYRTPSGRMRGGRVAKLSVVSKSRSTASSAISTSATDFHVLADQEPGAGIAADPQDLREEPPVPQHRVALLAAERRQHDQPALVRVVHRQQPVDHPPGHQRHVAQADQRRRAFRRHRRDAGLQAGRQPLGIVRRVHVPHRPAAQRVLDLLRLVAESPPGSAGRWTTAHCRPRGRSSACRSCRRPAACCAAPSAASARPPAPPRRSSARCAARRRLRRLRRRLFARHRPRLDLLQQPADAHSHHVAPASPSARRTAGSARSRCRSASGCGRSRAAPGPGARRCGRGRSGCRDRPACRNAGSRRRPARCPAGPTSRRSTTAEAPTTSSRSAPSPRAAPPARGRSPPPSCAQCTGGSSVPVRRGDPLLGGGDGLVGDAVLQPGQFGDHQPDLQARGTDAASAASRPAAPASPPPSARCPAPRTGSS